MNRSHCLAFVMTLPLPSRHSVADRPGEGACDEA